MSTLFIFALLIALMLTGMPISIALGLTVLTFLFTLTEGADRERGAEAVHRHREVRDHGDPVLHPGRQFPHAWRRGRRMINFATDGRPLAWRSRPRRRDGLRAVRRVSRLLARPPWSPSARS
jgi:hypothetical protein